MSIRRLLVLLTAAVLVPACGGSHDSVAPPPTPRTLGLHVGGSELSTYDGAVHLARSAGVSAVPLLLPWKSLETAPGVYDGTLLDIVNAYYPATSIRVSLTIAALNTNVNELPSDLSTLPFDHPTVLARFRQLLDFVFARIPALDLVSLNIGNEVDASLSGAVEVGRYATFYAAAADYARSKRSGLLVGVVVSFTGLTGPDKALFQSLNASSDIISVTYYPLTGDFKVRPPSAVASDVQAVLEAYPATPIYIQEAGYPSSAACDSSEQAQAEFVREVFKAWDAHADRIPFLAFLSQTDWPPAVVDDLSAYYHLSTPGFKGYLGSLGLRTWSGTGTDKPAWSTLRTEAAARGW